MQLAMLLLDAGHVERLMRDDLPAVIDHNGVAYSRRAGPSIPAHAPEGAQWETIAIYADDVLTEEEFQDLYHALRPQVAELNLSF
jgi:hypothetical protein